MRFGSLGISFFNPALRIPASGGGTPTLQKIWVTYGAGDDEAWSFDPDGSNGAKQFDTAVPGTDFIYKAAFDFNNRRFWYHQRTAGKVYRIDIDTGVATLVGTSDLSGAVERAVLGRDGSTGVFLITTGTTRGLFHLPLDGALNGTLRTTAAQSSGAHSTGRYPGGPNGMAFYNNNITGTDIDLLSLDDWAFTEPHITSAGNCYWIEGFTPDDDFTAETPTWTIWSQNSQISCKRTVGSAFTLTITGLSTAQGMALDPWPYIGGDNPSYVDLYFLQNVATSAGGIWKATLNLPATGSGTVISSPVQLAQIASSKIHGIDLEFSPVPVYEQDMA